MKGGGVAETESFAAAILAEAMTQSDMCND